MCDRNVNLRHDLQELRSGHDLGLDPDTSHEEIDLDSGAILI
jgi:hypothetical protein